MCYFSYKKFFKTKFHTEIIALALLISATLSAYNSNLICQAQTITQPAAANNEQNARDNLAVPGSATLLPPELPPRTRPPLPVLPPNNAPAFSQSKTSLAWRHKAMKLAQDKYKAGGPDTASNSMLRAYGATYSDSLMALASSCAIAGFKVESINSNAGELLAVNKETNAQIVFSIWEQTAGKTWISAGSNRGSSAANTKNAILILDTTGNTIGKRGRI